MELTTARTDALRSRIRSRAGTRDEVPRTSIVGPASASKRLVHWVNESTLRRLWEWAAIGFAFRGFTPL
jgi:hypothetical protein